MPSKRDYYEILGVGRDAATADIKKSYRKMAMRYHPDRNPGDTDAEEKFKESAEAFEVLSDPEKRRLYDQFGHEGPSRVGFNGFSSTDDIFNHFDGMFGGLFETMGFGQRRRGGPQRGADIKIEILIDLNLVVTGGNRVIAVPRQDRCDDCGGSGAQPGTLAQTCRQCGGQGHVVHRQGFFTLQTTCHACQGNGKIVVPCAGCAGSGFITRDSRITISVPAGIADGQILRVQGRGLPGARGGTSGDLHVAIRVATDIRFTRDGNDIHSHVRVSMFQAALGCKAVVEMIHGTETIQVDPGTQPGHVVKILGKGIPVLGGHGHGDHHVHVDVCVAETLDERHEEMLRTIAEERGESVEQPRTTRIEKRSKRKG